MVDAATATAPDALLGRVPVDRDEWLRRGLLVAIGLYLLVALALPLVLMLAKSFQDADARWVGLANYRTYFATPALATSIRQSFQVSLLSTLITVPLAFVYAYAGKVTGEALALAGKAEVPKDASYYAFLVGGLVATVAATTVVTRTARRALQDV